MTLPHAIGALRAALYRRRWLAAAIFILLGGIGSYAVIAPPPLYAAETTLLAKFGREYTFRSDTATGTFMPNVAMDDIVNTIIEILKSESLAEQVVAEVGPETVYPYGTRESAPGLSPLHAGVSEFLRNLRITPVRRSNVVVLEFRHVDPKMAARVLNRYVEAFQTKYLSLYGESRADFMGREVGLAKTAYAEAGQAVTAFEAGHATFAKDTQVDTLSQRRAEAETQRARLAACCDGSDALEQVTRQVGVLDARIRTANEAQAILARLVRTRDIMQENYDAAERKAQEARISRALDESRLSSVQVIDAATPPPRPVRPGRKVKLALVLSLSLLLACALALLAEMRRRRFTTAEELRRAYRLPVLAELPRESGLSRAA